MYKIKETVRTFILKIRRSDESVKRMWVYVFSGTLTVLVLFLWVGYLNITLPKLSQPPDMIATGTDQLSKPDANTRSFFGVLGNGFHNIIGDLSAGASSIGNTFSKTYENAKKSFGGTKTDIRVELPSTDKAPEKLFLDLNGTSSPTSSLIAP